MNVSTCVVQIITSVESLLFEIIFITMCLLSFSSSFSLLSVFSPLFLSKYFITKILFANNDILLQWKYAIISLFLFLYSLPRSISLFISLFLPSLPFFITLYLFVAFFFRAYFWKKCAMRCCSHVTDLLLLGKTANCRWWYSAIVAHIYYLTIHSQNLSNIY
jgi:hypothetical protein